MAAARASSDKTGVATDDEISIERRVGPPSAERDDYLARLDDPFHGLDPTAEQESRQGEQREQRDDAGPRPPSRGASPDESAVVSLYLTYLRAQQIPAQFLPQFEAEALAFRTRFRHIATEQLDGEMLAVYLREGQLQSLPERALRNRRVGCQAFVDFLRERGRRMAPAVAAAPPIPRAAAQVAPSDKRRSSRVPFLAEVRIDNVGVLRCADISVGGMYLEKLTMVVRGTLLTAHFKLRASDIEVITVTIRVTFVHPQFGAGVEFVSISPRDVKRIAEFVAHAAPAPR